jgi:hypothetical protein
MKSVLPLLPALLLAAPLAAQSALQVPFDHVELVSSGAAHVTLDGSAVLGASEAAISVNQAASGALKGLTAGTTLEGALSLEISADAAGSFSETLPLVALPLPAFTVGSDVSVSPFSVLLLTVSGDAAFGLRTSFVQHFAVHADVALGPGFHVSVEQGPSLQLAGQPDIAAGSGAQIEVSATLAVVYLLDVGGVPIGGPFAGVALGVDAQIDPLADPWWSVDGSLDILAGYWGLGLAPQIFPAGLAHFGDAGGPLLGAPPSTRWSVSLQSDAYDFTQGVVPTPGGFLLSGRRSFGADPFLARIGPDGALLSAEVSSFASNGSGQQLVASAPTADGGLVQAGNASGGVRLDRLDAGGVKVWSKLYLHAAAFPPGVVDVEALPDGGFACLARVVLQASPGIGRAFVLRVDADGQLLWARDLFLGGTDPGYTVRDLAPTADGGLLLAGYLNWTELHGSELALFGNNLLLARLEPDGDLAFAEVLGSVGNEQGTCVAEGLEGQIWVGGGLIEGPSTWAWLSSFGADGAPGSSIKLRGADTGIFSVPVRALVPLPGGVRLLGDRGLGAGRDAWLALISSGGLPLTWTGLGGPGEDAALGLRALPDGLLAWGWTKSLDAQGSGTGADHWLLRTSVDGLLHFDPASGFEASHEPVDWGFPANDFASAVLLAPTVQPAAITVSDKPLPYATVAATEIVLTP